MESTATPLRAAVRSRALRALGWVLAAAIVVFVAVRLAGPLRALREQALPEHPDWWLLSLSGVGFLAAHAVLVQTWRGVLSCWDERLPYWSAARVWSVSNLGRYVPGWIWQIGAMGAMSRQLGVSPVAAAASAILGTLVNVLAGFVVSLVAGRAVLEHASAGGTGVAVLVLVVAVATLLSAPFLLPRVAPLLARLTRRPMVATLPTRAILYALVGNLVAWVIYGEAFRLFVGSITGNGSGAYQAYLAVYTVSYLAGYLSFITPAGLGVREGFMVALLTFAGLTTQPEAALVAITSRVWLTLLEVVPGFLFWAHSAMRGRPPTTDPSDVPT